MTTWEIHSGMFVARAAIEPFDPDELSEFEEATSGIEFSPEQSSIKIIITGNSWDDKRILTYGVTSKEDAESMIGNLKNALSGHEVSIKVTDEPLASNLAVNGEFESEVAIRETMDLLSERGVEFEYEPEQFPALIISIDNPQSKVLVFSNGKFTAQGLKSVEGVEKMIEKIDFLIEES